jgi:hypothetical protein
MTKLLPILIAAICCATCSAQPPQVNANQYVPPYLDGFGYGSNMGVYPPYTDDDLALLVRGSLDGKIPGIGATTIRPALPENFLEQWGYDIRLNTFNQYKAIGLENLTVFIGFPSEKNRDAERYCSEGPPETFKGMYLDIWDNGANGTPVNDSNAYALYVYKLATTYKGLIRYYEVMNEPDFDLKGNAWKPADMPGNWWVNTPQPCEFKMRAPVYSYIRMLRISYEVIKSIDPTAFIAIGGVGYPSFLDVICRNSDNPNGGTLTSKYPFKGGAYFDCLSYHAYPHIDNSLREWDIPKNQFRYFRHSDAAYDGVWKQRDAFKSVLLQFGYNGTTYPKKRWIITEINIPRKVYGDFIGSDEAQVNFMVKALIGAQMQEVDQIQVYNMGDETKESDATSEFSFMGLFKNMTNETLFAATKNKVAVGFHSASMIMEGYKYDAAETFTLQLPANIRGGAFKNASDDILYALWATTQMDNNEYAAANYSFPIGTQAAYLEEKRWNFSETGHSVLVNARNISLNGTPKFFTKALITDATFPKDLTVYPNPLSDSNQCTLSFYNYEDQIIDIDLYDNKGRLVQKIAEGLQVVRGGQQFLINLTQQTKGTYFIRLKTAGGIQTIPIIWI